MNDTNKRMNPLHFGNDLANEHPDPDQSENMDSNPR